MICFVKTLAREIRESFTISEVLLIVAIWFILWQLPLVVKVKRKKWAMQLWILAD